MSVATHSASSTSPSRRRLSASDFERLAADDILGSHERLELVDGDLIELPRPSPAEVSARLWLQRLFHQVAGDRVLISIFNPLVLSGQCVLRPDLAILDWRDDFFRDGHPGARDATLVVEIAERLRDFRADDRVQAYARAGVSEYWLVLSSHESIRVNRMPNATGYSYASDFAAHSAPELLHRHFAERPDVTTTTANEGS